MASQYPLCSALRAASVAAVVLATFVNRASAQSQPIETQPATSQPTITPKEAVDIALGWLADASLDPDEQRRSQAYQAALKILQDVSNVDPTIERLNLLQALLLIAANRASEAIQPLEEYNKTPAGKTDYRGFLAVGRLYKASKAWRLADKPLAEARRLAPLTDRGRPLRAEITMDQAFVSFNLGQQEEALQHAQDAVVLAPDVANMHLALADISLLLKNYESALNAVVAAVQLLREEQAKNPIDLGVHQRLLPCYDVFTSIQTIQIQQQPQNPNLYLALCTTRLDVIDLRARIELIQIRLVALKTEDTVPDDPNAQSFIASLEIRLGVLDMAKERLERILEKHPDHPQSRLLYAQLAQATTTAPAATQPVEPAASRPSQP